MNSSTCGENEQWSLKHSIKYSIIHISSMTNDNNNIIKQLKSLMCSAYECYKHIDPIDVPGAFLNIKLELSSIIQHLESENKNVK